jgi:hypothetical protein
MCFFYLHRPTVIVFLRVLKCFFLPIETHGDHVFEGFQTCFFSYYIDTPLQEEPRDLTDPIALQRPQRGL